MFKNIFQKITQNNIEFDKQCKEIQSQKLKSQQQFEEDYTKTQKYIDEISRKIGLITRNK